MSSTSVKENGSLNISLLGFDPPFSSRSFDFLNLHYIGPNGRLGFIADYSRFSQKLRLRNPRIYAGRIRLSGSQAVTISPIKIPDEKTKYYFEYVHNSGSSVSVLSETIQLQHVYGKI